MTARLGGFDWQVISAPGHDPHAVILFNPDTRVLISADALWERGFGVIFPELEGESGFAEQPDSGVPPSSNSTYGTRSR